MLKKVKKELERFKKRLFYTDKDKQFEEIQFKLTNTPYEIYDGISRGRLELKIPAIKTVDETMDKILQDKCSIARFGDGEFNIMNGGHINYQDRNSELARRLKEVISINKADFLIGIPDKFGSLDDCLPPVARFWREWMSKKREIVYSFLDMDHIYYNNAFSRVYMECNKTDGHYAKCDRYYERMKKIWANRDVIICEGEETRFGMFNDLLTDVRSISRILCPARNAFEKYDEILLSFSNISKDKLILIALGPTATVLAYDLCNKGYQAIDIGATDLDYEWFLRKETELGAPIKFKYVDGSCQGRKVQRLNDPEYQKQIIKTIV